MRQAHGCAHQDSNAKRSRRTRMQLFTNREFHNWANGRPNTNKATSIAVVVNARYRLSLVGAFAYSTEIRDKVNGGTKTA
jgi:hypothetical protein